MMILLNHIYNITEQRENRIGPVLPQEVVILSTLNH